MYELLLIVTPMRGGKVSVPQPGEYDTIESAVLAGLQRGTSFMVWDLSTHQLVGEWWCWMSGDE